MAKLSCVMFALAATGGSAANVLSRMKIDADGMVDKFTANTDANTAADTAQMVLAEMEDWARFGARPEEPKIKTIEGLAQQLDKALMETHAETQKEVHEHIKNIENCNSIQASAIKTISETDKVEVGKQRTTHATCRDGEVVTFKHMEANCTHLTTWLKETIEGSPEKPAGAVKWECLDEVCDEMVEYVKKMDGYWCGKGEAAEKKQKDCEKWKEDHRAENKKCDALQAQFEIDFCLWRTKLINVCDTQKTCYEDEKKVYRDHVNATQELVIKWKTEYTALKKILCYVKVWLSDGNAETVDAGELKRCQELRPNCSKMDIDFGKAPEKSKCSLEDVAKYPGTDAFKNKEYKKWAKFVDEPTACLEVQTETSDPFANPHEY